VAIAGATNASYTIASAASTDAATYEALASNSAGTVKSNASTVTVTSSGAPQITSQPASQTVPAGSDASFSVTASGSPAPTYQWRKNGTAISGATAATLVLRSITSADAATYTVLVTNLAGSVLSSNAVLSVGAPPVFTVQPATQAVNLGTYVALSATASGVPSPALQWFKNGVAIPGANYGTLAFSSITSSDLATYHVTATNSSGSARSVDATLVVAGPPVITSQPTAARVPAGSTVTFAVEATASPAPTYQWKKGVVNIAGATTSKLTLVNVQLADEGDYRVEVSNSVGWIQSSKARLQVTDPTTTATNNAGGKTGNGKPGTAKTETETTAETAGSASRIINLSVRSRAGTGDDGLIVGFVIGGSSAKSMLLRGVGPTLGDFGVADALFDPTLKLYSGSEMTASNDDWSNEANAVEIVGTSARLGAFSLPEAGADSAMMARLATGAYTLQLNSKTSASGVALAEVYDAAASDPSSLVNLSVRTAVGTGADAPNVGFVVSGTTPKRVMIRAVGPTLAAFGVTNVLADPQLEIFREGVLLDTNDNWSGDPLLAETFARVGAFALADDKSRDAVLFMTLMPGAYTVVASGVNSGTGIALVEVYDVP
jgi:hypothetical protein